MSCGIRLQIDAVFIFSYLHFIFFAIFPWPQSRSWFLRCRSLQDGRPPGPPGLRVALANPQFRAARQWLLSKSLTPTWKVRSPTAALISDLEFLSGPCWFHVGFSSCSLHLLLNLWLYGSNFCSEVLQCLPQVATVRITHKIRDSLPVWWGVEAVDYIFHRCLSSLACCDF